MKKAFNSAWVFLKNETYLQDLQDMARYDKDPYEQGQPEGIFYEQIDPELQRQFGPIPTSQQLMNLQREIKPHEAELLSQYMTPQRRHSERHSPTPEDTGPLEEMDSGEMRRLPNKEERFGTMEKPMLNPSHYNRFLQSIRDSRLQ